MKNIFIIPGYGIPQDILKDEQCRRYLGLAFNHIYQTCVKENNHQPLIIFAGGPTDIFKPYQRTEAAEMKKLFLTYAQRNFVKKYTKNWSYKLEKNSLSTVENITGTEQIIKKIKGKKFIYIFVEFTRTKKIKTFAKQIIKKDFKIVSLDFDLSINRYRDPEFIKKKEALDIKFGLQSISNKEFYSKYRQSLENKIKFYRQQGPGRHGKAINEYWQQELKNLNNL